MPSKNKIACIALALFFPLSSFAVGTWAPTTITSGTDVISCSVGVGEQQMIFDPYGVFQGNFEGDCNGNTWDDNLYGEPNPPLIEGVWHVLLVVAGVQDCQYLSYENCLNDLSYLGQNIAINVIAAEDGFSLVSSETITGFLGDTGAAVVTTGLTLWPIAAIVIGIFFSFWTIEKVMEIFRQETKGEKAARYIEKRGDSFATKEERKAFKKSFRRVL